MTPSMTSMLASWALAVALSTKAMGANFPQRGPQASECGGDTCTDTEVCAVTQECVDTDSVVVVTDADPDTNILAMISYNSSDPIMVVGDPNGGIGEIDLSDVHFIWDKEKGIPIGAYIDGNDDVVVYFEFDDDGNLIDATESGGRRQLVESLPANNRLLGSSSHGGGGVTMACGDFCELLLDNIESNSAQFCATLTCVDADLSCHALDVLCKCLIPLTVLLVDDVCDDLCLEGDEGDDDETATVVDSSGITLDGDELNDDITLDGDINGDPHMVGLLGQKIDWSGKEGNWYVIMHDGPEKQIAARVTAPLADKFPDRQLITGISLISAGGHSIIIEASDPYSTEAAGCPAGMMAPCLAEGSLRVTVDGEVSDALLSPGEKIKLPGGFVVSAANLPAECQPFGGDLEWAATFKQMSHGRQLMDYTEKSLLEFIKTWTSTTAAPLWCDKFLMEQGAAGLFVHSSKHVVFKIDSPHFSVRLHHGTNHQGGEILPDGRTLPQLEFWQMNIHITAADIDHSTVTGILGETARPVLDTRTGAKIMTGPGALGADVEDFRLSGPLSTEFSQVFMRDAES